MWEINVKLSWVSYKEPLESLLIGVLTSTISRWGFSDYTYSELPIHIQLKAYVRGATIPMQPEFITKGKVVIPKSIIG